jgi:hypothetical protein
MGEKKKGKKEKKMPPSTFQHGSRSWWVTPHALLKNWEPPM